jgi:hypothetical protein
MIGLQCLTCDRRHESGNAAGLTTCDAFLDGIPFDVLSGKLDHRHAIDGDSGLLYQPAPGTDTSDMDDGIIEPFDVSIEDGPLI